MADAKISALPAAATPLAGTEVLPVVQGGVTDKVSVANLTVGRDVGVKKLNATDNVVISTAGKGIDFSANGGDVLTQYDEGSWTVKLFDAAGGGNQSATTVTGYYTRVGNLVHCAFWGMNNISTAGMTAGNVLHIELPFTASATGSGTGSFASENITFNGRDNATPAVPVGYNRAIIRAYGSATSSASVLVSNVGAGANIDYFSMTYRV